MIVARFHSLPTMRVVSLVVLLLCIFSVSIAIKSRSKAVSKKASRRHIKDDDDDDGYRSKIRSKKTASSLKKKGSKTQLVKWTDPRKLKSRVRPPSLKERLESLAYQGSTAYKNAFRQVKVRFYRNNFVSV